MSTGHKARPQAKDISDEDMLRYLADDKAKYDGCRTYEIMAAHFQTHEKVIDRVLERLAKRGYIDWGVSIRLCWLTDKGKELIA